MRSAAPAQHGEGNGKADQHFGLPGSVERRNYPSTYQRRWLPISQVEVWLLYLEP